MLAVDAFFRPPVVCLLVLLVPLVQDAVLAALVPVVDAHLQQREEFCTHFKRQKHLGENGFLSRYC